jgi:hypothetical protein
MRTHRKGSRVYAEYFTRWSADFITNMSESEFSASFEALSTTCDEDKIITAPGEAIGVDSADTRGCAGDDSYFS